MTNAEFRKTLGRRIKSERKGRGFTQKELGALVGISFAQLNKYESGQNGPPLSLLPAMAEALEVSADFLLTGKRLDLPITNTRLLKRVRAIEDLSREDSGRGDSGFGWLDPQEQRSRRFKPALVPQVVPILGQE